MFDRSEPRTPPPTMQQRSVTMLSSSTNSLAGSISDSHTGYNEMKLQATPQLMNSGDDIDSDSNSNNDASMEDRQRNDFADRARMSRASIRGEDLYNDVSDTGSTADQDVNYQRELELAGYDGAAVDMRKEIAAMFNNNNNDDMKDGTGIIGGGKVIENASNDAEVDNSSYCVAGGSSSAAALTSFAQISYGSQPVDPSYAHTKFFSYS